MRVNPLATQNPNRLHLPAQPKWLIAPKEGRLRMPPSWDTENALFFIIGCSSTAQPPTHQLELPRFWLMNSPKFTRKTCHCRPLSATYRRARLVAAAEKSFEVQVELLEHASMYLCLPRVDCPNFKANSAGESGTPFGSVESTSKSKPAVGAHAVTETAPPASPKQKPSTPNGRETLLLQWDAGSLTSLMNIHREIAAVLLRSVRKTMTEVSSPTSLSPTCTPFCEHVQLFRKAADSLTVSLAATGVARFQPLFVESKELVEAEKETRIANGLCFRSPATVDPNFISHDDDSEELLPATTLTSHRPNRWRPAHSKANPHEGKNERASSPSPNVRSEVETTSTGGSGQSVLWHITARKANFSIASLENIAELYAMRCTASEGLGLLEVAFNDAREALILTPRTPKLLAKAASVALRIGSTRQISGVQDWAGAQRETIEVWRQRRRLVFVSLGCVKPCKCHTKLSHESNGLDHPWLENMSYPKLLSTSTILNRSLPRSS